MRTIDGIEVEVHKLSFPFTLFAKGMVYSGKIYTQPNPTNRLVRHEMIHVAQNETQEDELQSFIDDLMSLMPGEGSILRGAGYNEGDYAVDVDLLGHEMIKSKHNRGFRR